MIEQKKNLRYTFGNIFVSWFKQNRGIILVIKNIDSLILV